MKSTSDLPLHAMHISISITGAITTTIILSARAIAVDTPPLAVARTTSKTLAVPRRAHWAAATEEAACFNTVQDATSIAEVCLHATCTALPCIPSTARLCVAALAF